MINFSRKLGKVIRNYLLYASAGLLAATNASAQYCATVNSGGNGSMISNVLFGSINNNSASSQPSTSPFYTYYTTATTSVVMGTTENLTITVDPPGFITSAIVSVWIDWDQDGSFASSEWLQVGTNVVNATPATISIPIPLSAVAGTTRMRIRSRGTGGSNGAGNACSYMSSGETEDYDIFVVPATLCSGIPLAGAAVSNPIVCPGLSYNVSLSGATMASGLSYQWEATIPSLNSWSPIPGATNANYSTTMTASMDYRCVIACGSNAITSLPVSVTQNSFLNCYCASIPSLAFDGEIFNTTVGALNNSSTCSQTGNSATSILNRYSDYMNLPATTLAQGGTYPVSVTAGSCGGSYAAYVKIFVDYDHDGAFTTSGEEVYAGVPPGGLYTPTGVAATGAFTVAASSLLGQTRMRVILHQTTAAADVQPCSNGNYSHGETEDYLVNITAPINCASVAGGTAASSKPSVCLNETFTLSATGYTLGASGIMYQWEESPTGLNSWSPIANATSPYHTLTQSMASDYRLVVTCMNNSAVAHSASVSVPMSPFYVCYCSPITGMALHTWGGQNISNVSIPTTSLNNSSTVAGIGSYSQYLPSVPSQTANLQQGGLYQLNVTQLYNGYGVDAWIDYDQNGLFDISEYLPFTGVTSNANLTLSYSLFVPYTSLTGNTGMRIRVYYPPAYGAGNACQNYGYETEDYVINIVPSPACSGIPPAAVASASVTSACPGQNFTLTASGFSIGSGMGYQWQESPAGLNSWSPVSNPNSTSPILTHSQSAAMDYRFVSTCTNAGGGSSNSNLVSVAANPMYICYCGPATNVNLNDGPYDYITRVVIPGTTLNSISGTAGPASGYTLFSPTAAATASLAQGVSYNLGVKGQYAYDYSVAWIDFDQSGTFDASEYIVLTNTPFSYSDSAGGTFTVPVGAINGQTGMRIRRYWNALAATQACAVASDYETEDYIITIVPVPSCLPPSVLSATNVTSGSADIGWTANNASVQSQIQYGVGAFALGTGTIITTGSNPHTINGLLPNTTYTFYVRDICGPNDTSTWAAGGGFITPCTAITSLPWSENFDALTTVGNTSFPGCWFKENGDWETSTATAYTQPNSGSNHLIDDWSATNEFIWAPGFRLTANVSYDFSFFVAGDGGTSWTVDVFENSTASSIGATQLGSTYTVPGTTCCSVQPYNKLTRTFVPSATGVYYLGVRVNEPTGGPVNIGFDDFTMEITPTCPSPLSLVASNLTTTTADVAWTPNSTAAQFQVQYGPAPFTLGTGITITTTNNPLALSGLTPSTPYTFYVRGICGPGDTSSWSPAGNFITACGIITSFPWSYTVETQPTNAGVGALTNCWSANPTPGFAYSWWVTGDGTTGSFNTGPSTAHSGTKYFFTEASNGFMGDIATLTSPSYNITGLSTPALEFWYHMFGATIDKLVVEIQDGAGWHRVDSLVGQQQTAETAPWILKSIPLNAFSGVIQVRFEGKRGSSFTGDMAIDDIAITNNPLVIRMDKINATNNGSSNRIEWSTLSEEKGDEFQLERSRDGQRYEVIHEEAANGKPSRYTYIDNVPFIGINYYRLLIKNARGNEGTYSKVVTANAGGNIFTVEAFPNPVTGILAVKVHGIPVTEGRVQVTDVTGKILKTAAMNGNTVAIHMGDLTNGVYLIKYSDTGHTQTIRVTKQ